LTRPVRLAGIFVGRFGSLAEPFST